MTAKWRLLSLSSVLIGCSTLLGIDGDYSSDEETLARPIDEAGNAVTEGGFPQLDPACAPLPSTSTDGIREGCAVFVSPTGADGNAGTRDQPVQTIKAGILRAAPANKRVFVCNATYTETVQPELPVALFGGFVCPGDASAAPWTYVAGSVPQVNAPGPGEAALLVKKVAGTVHVEDFAFTAPATSNDHISSIAAIVTETPLLQLARVQLTAGDGHDGTTIGGPPAPAAPPAKPGVGTSDPITCTCETGGTTIGGAMGCPGGTGQPKYDPPSPAGATGASPGFCGNGTAGSNAPQGRDGDGGALGQIVGETFIPGSGDPGTNGLPGQGGGGACSGGGSGGCGGCGGGGGPAGTGGGASIGVLARSAGVELVACTIRTGKGGIGGPGKPGADGGAGAAGAAFFGLCFGLPVAGGHGGNGGGGGGGGGGAGGTTACVVYSGPDAPKLDDATRNACSRQNPGDGGTSPGLGGRMGISDVLIQVASP
jgi:hypothetical protein